MIFTGHLLKNNKKLLSTLCCLVFSLVAYSQNITGKVISIKDGDTIEILYLNKPLKIRLFGIDCPEKKQDFGEQAKKYTSSLCFGKTITVIKHGNDQYRRLLGEVILPNGLNLNQELVKKGYAWRYKTSKDKTLAKFELQAREHKYGLWAMPSAIPPWQFRYQALHSK